VAERNGMEGRGECGGKRCGGISPQFNCIVARASSLALHLTRALIT
jgi:hypothetical protein